MTVDHVTESRLATLESENRALRSRLDSLAAHVSNRVSPLDASYAELQEQLYRVRIENGARDGAAEAHFEAIKLTRATQARLIGAFDALVRCLAGFLTQPEAVMNVIAEIEKIAGDLKREAASKPAMTQDDMDDCYQRGNR